MESSIASPKPSAVLPAPSLNPSIPGNCGKVGDVVPDSCQVIGGTGTHIFRIGVHIDEEWQQDAD